MSARHKHAAHDGPEIDPDVKPAQVAKILGICQRTLYRWIALGIFPPPGQTRGRNYWSLSSVIRWKASRPARARRAA